MNTKTFQIRAWCKEEKNFIACNFLCEIIKHKALKKYANNGVYWFKELDGNNWRGGWYDEDSGFINAKVLIDNNVQGVVIDGIVYKLISVEPI